MTDDGSRRVALVTGSSRGIGYEIAKALGLAGNRVVLNSRHPADLEKAAGELREMGIDAMPVSFDVSKPEDIEAGFRKIEQEYGGVDILVNNAGITRDRSFAKMSVEEWQEVIDTNMNSMFHCSKHAIGRMMERKWGRIVNTASIVGRYGAFGQVNYAASKAGVIGFTRALARELARKGITVNAIAPGYISTEMTAQIPEGVADGLKSRIPLGSFGEPEDVAAVVAFLCSEEARYVNGAIIHVDGGY